MQVHRNENLKDKKRANPSYFVAYTMYQLYILLLY